MKLYYSLATMQNYLSPKGFLFVLGALIVLATLVTFPSYYFYNKYKKAQTASQNAKVLSKEEVTSLLEKVGRLAELPTGEEPTIATVTDQERLQKQPFFARAQNGDKVIVFQQAKKAILYRPSTNEIIEMSSVNIATTDANLNTAFSTTPSPTPLPEIKIALYNGTDIKGLTNIVEKDLKANLQNVQVIAKNNAKNKNYQKSLIVDFTNKNLETVNKLITLTHATVGTLPPDEAKPSPSDGIDVLLIVGKDYLTPD